MQRLKLDDEVVVVAGKDKGKKGQVLRVQTDGKLIVDGVNVAKKHVKANPNSGEAGGIVDKNMPIDPSNVMYFNRTSGKGERIGFRVLEDGKKVRFCKSSNEVID